MTYKLASIPGDGIRKRGDLRPTLQRPLIGIGAPAVFFVPQTCYLLGVRTIVPENPDVANSVGAITSEVAVRRQLKVKPTSEGFFTIEGVQGEKVFSNFDQAYCGALDELKSRVQQRTHATIVPRSISIHKVKNRDCNPQIFK